MIYEVCFIHYSPFLNYRTGYKGIFSFIKTPLSFIIVELKNIDGRSHKEIAEYLDISVTAAKVRLHRAHQKLRVLLENVDR